MHWWTWAIVALMVSVVLVSFLWQVLEWRKERKFGKGDPGFLEGLREAVDDVLGRAPTKRQLAVTVDLAAQTASGAMRAEREAAAVVRIVGHRKSIEDAGRRKTGAMDQLRPLGTPSPAPPTPPARPEETRRPAAGAPAGGQSRHQGRMASPQVIGMAVRAFPNQATDIAVAMHAGKSDAESRRRELDRAYAPGDQPVQRAYEDEYNRRKAELGEEARRRQAEQTGGTQQAEEGPPEHRDPGE